MYKELTDKYEQLNENYQELNAKYVHKIYSQNSISIFLEFIIEFFDGIKNFFNITYYTFPELPNHLIMALLSQANNPTDLKFCFDKDIITIIKAIIDNRPISRKL